MRTVCSDTACAGCYLCFDICPVKAIRIDEGIKFYNSEIDEDRCVECGTCHRFCPQNNAPLLMRPKEWHQGWSKDGSVRAGSSSGGLATEISRSFIRHGGEVLTCRFKEGEFVFDFFDDISDLSEAAGSKYVKSRPKGVYKPLLARLDSGKKVLMIALPCQIAAAKAYTRDHDGLYSIDLICHGTPAPEVLRSYLKSREIELEGLTDIRFRQKTRFGLGEGYHLVDERMIDSYTYAFLNSLIYTDNCYDCRYARFERGSDITLGDSWGSELGDDEKEKGISIILCQTQKGGELLSMSELELKDINIEKEVRANMQLQRPSREPRTRRKLLERLGRGEEFEAAMFRVMPVSGIIRMIKGLIPSRRTCGYRGGTA